MSLFERPAEHANNHLPAVITITTDDISRTLNHLNETNTRPIRSPTG